jgi:spermidine synthase
MILELVGSRILAPTLGTSIYVWTSLIGIILGAMSLGYYLGGRLSDKDPNTQTFSNLLLISGLFVFFIIVMKKPVLDASIHLELKYAAIFAALTLFSIPGILLGAISPYSVRLAMKNVETSGNTVGNLYAVSTFGSIIGTFLAGFYFIPNYGSTNILYGLAIGLCVISLIANSKKDKAIRLMLVFFLAIGVSVVAGASETNKYLVDEDSEYNHIRVYDTTGSDGKTLRIMSVENAFDSGMYLDSDELAFAYSKYFRLADLFNRKMKKVAVFGGAAYTIPKDILKRHEATFVDVVEIDPKTTKIAEEYFNLDRNNERLGTYHMDARKFLNEKSGAVSEKYDAIYNDAFSSTCTVPFQLTTLEAVKQISGMLNDEGVYVMNVISSIRGEKSEFFRSEFRTMKSVFKNVYVFATVSNEEKYSEINQNLVVIAVKKDYDIGNMAAENIGNEYGEMITKYWNGGIEIGDAIILTDDYAPVEHFTSKLCQVVNRN